MLRVLVCLALACRALAAEPAYSAPGGMHTGTRARVRELDGDSLQQAVTKHRRLIVMMHDGGANTATRAFQPWLYALANLLPHVPFGQLDVSRGRGGEVAEAFGVSDSQLPQLKLFVRDNAKGKRVVDYQGPLDFDAVLGWARAAIDDQEHAFSAYGFEPEGADEFAAAGGGNGGGGGGGAMGQLPESVRRMAETMVRETRLQRVLKQQGGDRAAIYEAKVANKYQEIIDEEGTDMSNKFSVQEANRRARDEVLAELMMDAPPHIRAEVEADVSLGDAAKQGSGDGDGKKKRKRKS